MAEEIFGSHEKPLNGYGQNGDPSPSSLTPGQEVKHGTVAKSIMSPVTVPSDSAQTRTVSAQPIVPSFGMKRPSAAAKVPNAIDRRKS